MKAVQVLVAVLFFVAACAPIQHRESAVQQTDKILRAGVGDVVLRVEKTRNLENALGASDIFGRRTTEGFTEVVFAGVEPDGTVVLYRKDVQILTNETTMSRSGLSQTSGQVRTTTNGNAYGTANSVSVSGSSASSYSATTIGPVDDFHVVVPSGAIALRLKPAEKTIPVSGHLIEIIQATQYAIEYKVLVQ